MVVTQKGEGVEIASCPSRPPTAAAPQNPSSFPLRPWGEHPPGSSPSPYAVCDVWAEHPGYAMLLVEGGPDFFRAWRPPVHGAGTPERGAVQSDSEQRPGDSRPDPVRCPHACASDPLRAPHHHGASGSAGRVGGKCDGLIPGLCEKCGLQRDLSHLGAGGHPGQHPGHHFLCSEPGVHRVLSQPGL